MNYSFVGHCDLQRHCAIGRLDHSIALLLEKLPGQIAKVGLVLDHEDGFSTRLRGHGLWCSSNFCRALDCFGDTRQIDFESRTLAGLAVDPDVTAALLHDAVDGGEPETGSLRPLGSEE